MKILILILIFIPLTAQASVVGVSTHPLAEDTRVLSVAMTGYMSQRNEMGGGVRYTQGFDGNLLDVSVTGAQDSRNMSMGAGVDFEILKEEIQSPRVSVKPHVQQMRFEDQSSTLVGIAPSLRKGFSAAGQEIFPYLSLPNGMKIDSDEQEINFYSSLTFGASMAIPDSQERLVLSLEANKNLGASSDYVGALISWIWN